ncbi:MAG TPA: VWA domain-containing protein, partial [Bryobacteraceae bacterium]|nr:VWA domain-containing protein [Bryobacteraceae bacterium]
MRVASHFGLAFHTGTRLAVLLAAVLLISPRQGQALLQDDAPFRLRTDTRVVEIDVSVRDSQGRPVENLDKTDFKVTDNGKARPFTIFSINRGQTMSASRGAQPDNPPALAAGSTLPPNVFSNAGAFTPPQGHSTILLVDAINGWFDNFGLARQAVLGLLTKAPADEKIALYVLVKGVGMVTLQSYTTDRSKLATAIAQFTPRGMPAAPPRMEGSEGMIETPSNGKQDVSFSREPDLVQAGFTSIEEKEFAVRISAEDVRAALNGLAEQLKNVPGRKSVFWITQGFPPAQVRDVNQAGWDKTFANLNDANIAVNTVDDNGLGGPLRYWGPGAIRTLQQVAEATGGQAYFYRNDLDAAMASGIADSRSSYTLGFYLTQMDGKYHKLKVRVDRPGLELTYRLGYYAQNEG